MKTSIPPIVRAWRRGIALIFVLGMLGACPMLTGTIYPFLLVCCQVIVILTLVALTIVVRIWRQLPPTVKWMLLLALADRLAIRQPHAIHQEMAIPMVMPAEQAQRDSDYAHPSVDYPEMLPPQE